MAVGSAFLKSASIVVIGAGAVGSVVAYRLAQAGADVTIVERRFPGAGTTGSSFAWLNSFGKTPRAYHRLNVRSIGEHQDLARELGGDWVHIGGGLAWTHRDDHDRSERLRERVRGLRQWGYRVETLSPQQVMGELEPDLFIAPDRVDEIYYAPHEGWVNGVGLCHGAVSAAVRRYGARVMRDAVVGVGVRSASVESVTLAGGERLACDAVVNASGPDAARVAALAGIELPVDRQPGTLVVTEPAPVALKSVIHAPESFVHADGGWRLLLHRDDYDALVESEEPLDITDPFCQQAVENAAAILPGLKGVRPEGVRMGVRAMPKDGHPIIGFDPDVAGFYQAVMHSGVTLSAAVGSLVHDDFLGLESPDLDPYRPERFHESGRLAFHATSDE
jgi:glycine/D-amino acid oxidase-like deaminating enzyme